MSEEETYDFLGTIDFIVDPVITEAIVHSNSLCQKFKASGAHRIVFDRDHTVEAATLTFPCQVCHGLVSIYVRKGEPDPFTVNLPEKCPNRR